MKATHSYMKDHPIRIGLFVVLGVLFLGASSAFFFGYAAPLTAEAQVVDISTLVVTGAAATTNAVTTTNTTNTTTTTLVTTLVNVANTVLTTLTGQNNNNNTNQNNTNNGEPTTVDGVEITGAANGSGTTYTGSPSVTGPDGVTSVSEAVITAVNQNPSSDGGTTPSVTGPDGVTTVSEAVITAVNQDQSSGGGSPSVSGPGGVTDVSGVVVTAVQNDDNPFTLPCCTVPTTSQTTPSVIVPVIDVPTTLLFDVCANVDGLQLSVPSGLESDGTGNCVPPTPQPPVCTLIATPSSIQTGGASTLHWTTQRATSVSIDHSVGSVATDGSTVVTPSVTTSYTLTATGAGGTVTCPVMVTVTPTPPPPAAPVCALVANPSSIQLGSATNLTWTTQNATAVSIDHGVGTVATSGSQAVSPLFTTTYTLTATGAGGTVTCPTTVTVTVLPPPPAPPACTLTALPVAVQTGGSSILSWTTQNATSFSINQGINQVIPVTGGARVVTPSVTTTYTGTATGAGGTVHCSATVTVTNTPPPPAPSCALSAAPSVIQVGGTSVLTWSTTNATTVTINGGAVNPTGSASVNPLITTTYTLTATGSGGTVNCPATVTVTILPPPAPACTLTASPTAIQTGGTSILTWTTDNASTFSIDQGINTVTPVPGGSRNVSPTVTTTYTGTATGAGGTVHCTATVTVTPVPPAPACTLVANPVAVTLGGSSTLTWTTQNATSFSIDQGIGAVTTVDAGSRLVTPTVTTVYTGTATGAGGTVHCSASVTVTSTPPPTPPICTLVANPSAVQTGGTSVLTWTTQHATTFSIDQGVGAVTPIAGGTTATLTPANTTTYTGTATGPGGTTTCSATVTVTPTPPASQCVLTASPTSITKGSTSTLSWSGTNIASVIIDQAIGAKGPTGSVNVTPDSTTTYTGTFTTTTGQALSCSATVIVTTSNGTCTENCGGGGGGGHHSSPRVVLSALKSPTDQPLAFVYLSQIPYTGLDLGPWGTALYWLMLVLWSLAAAYLIFFNALPLAYRKVGVFGGSVKEALRAQPAMVSVAHAPMRTVEHRVQVAHAPAPVHHAPASAHAKPEAPAFEAHAGFKSYAAGSALTIDDIVKGLAREAQARPSATAHDLAPDFLVAHTEPIEAPMPAPVYVQEEASMPAPVARVEHPVAPFNEDVRHFIEALLRGDRDVVFGTVRGITRTGGDSEAFLTHAVCALDEAFRSRMDGSPCHPDIVAVTADCHPSFLERVVTSLTTAVDGSYSTGITGVKLALTRALAVVNG